MTKKTLPPVLCIGIDIGKMKHVAAFVSLDLLRAARRFERCPTLAFEQSREGIESLLQKIDSYGDRAQCAVLIEHTGHYHRIVEEHLRDAGLQVYIMPVLSRKRSQEKTDRIDALRLANQLYNQLVLGVQPEEKRAQIKHRFPPTKLAAQLRGLVQRHHELVHARTTLKNRLTAICDEIFPELTLIFKDPNLMTALSLRATFETPAAVAAASLEQLRSIRQQKGKPTDAHLRCLQELAAASIGVKDSPRRKTLLLEQKQLIEELATSGKHLEIIDKEISELMEPSREYKILASMSIGPIQAATIVAAIGNIRNFEKASHLRTFCGWSPQAIQTGISRDTSKLSDTGQRQLRQTLFLITINAVHQSESFELIYTRLVKRMCHWDARTETYKGKMRAIGHISGQICGLIYRFLRQDADLVDASPAEQIPPPVLFSPDIHLSHVLHGKPHEKPTNDVSQDLPPDETETEILDEERETVVLV